MMDRFDFDKKICIVTEDANGQPYVITADDYNEIVNDCRGERKFAPRDCARVYFATYNDEPVNPYMYDNFSSCVMYIKSLLTEH